MHGPLSRCLDGSRLVERIHQVVSGSSAVSAVDGVARALRSLTGSTPVVSRVRRLVHPSAVGATSKSRACPLTEAVRRSTVIRSIRTPLAWREGSSTVRWAHSGRDANVVLVDLGDSLTFGLPARTFDRTLSTAGSLAGRYVPDRFVRTALTTARETPVRAVSLPVAAVTAAALVTATLGRGTADGARPVLLVLFALAVLGTRVTVSLSTILASRPVVLLVSALTPPAVDERPSGEESDE